MPRVYLTKEFVESEGVELVVLHWTVAKIAAKPDWTKARSVALQAVKRDGKWIRQVMIDVDVEGDGPWSLHHFFEWVRFGVWQRGPAYFEDLAAVPIEYIDRSGEFTEATLVYNVGENGWTNTVSMMLDGALPPPMPGPEWPGELGESIVKQRRRMRAEELPAPRKFRASIVAPIGARVIYSIHLARRDGVNPMADTGRWVFRSEMVV
jgi:hypothetical protein